MPRPDRLARRTASGLRALIEIESSSGAILLVATVAAFVWANVLPYYETVWAHPVPAGPFPEDMRHWVNDGLMTVFFLVVGLEIKRELVIGELRDPKIAAMPMLAAVGGMLGPAAVYLALNIGKPTAGGWGIPMATDIAFLAGFLALLARRVPSGLKLFLVTLAVVDDVGAIVVIAIVYSHGADPLWLGAAAVCCAALLGVRALRASRLSFYALPAIVLWFAMLRSGVHPTMAGVLVGLLAPARPVRGRHLLEDAERRLGSVSSFFVMPVFALANAGIGMSATVIERAATSTVFWGVVLGLVAGKTAGIFLVARGTELLGAARRPRGVRDRDLLGGAALSGIGFTVALFIASLAFETSARIDEAKLGVLCGSIVSAVVGSGILTTGRRRSR